MSDHDPGDEDRRAAPERAPRWRMSRHLGTPPLWSYEIPVDIEGHEWWESTGTLRDEGPRGFRWCHNGVDGYAPTLDDAKRAIEAAEAAFDYTEYHRKWRHPRVRVAPEYNQCAAGAEG